jgi:hypothetical protein
MPTSVPHRCPECIKPEACGYNGQLVFGKGGVPTCNHNEKPGKVCHEQPVKMVPVK